ncbi:hypothetical protein V5O48_005870 [Marasmius crinis-equi]|uniref:Oxidoreductase AflY n=1 Tax=Marasmius crinis-equi TaxID=585013 RepID=A0ABR3FL36_9AGAR
MSTKEPVDLWPVPSLPPSQTSPTRLPGASYESTEVLREVLRKNHEKWHIFYDELGRHNHISHHVLAVWALGAHQDIVRDGYDKNENLQRPKGSSPEPITEENWIEHLGERPYYSAYIDFFTKIVTRDGGSKAMEDYLFSSKANFGSKNKADKHPEMLSRLQAGIMHGHIHVGYGAEFGLPGMLVEGLAESAVSEPEGSEMVPAALFTAVDAETQFSVASRLQSVLSLGGGSAPAPSSRGVDAFTVIARIGQDVKIVSKVMGLDTMFVSLSKDCGDALYKHVSDWALDVSSPESVQAKIEELQWAMTLMYAVPGYKQLDGGEFNADFLSVHFVTSAIFLPSLVTRLSPRSQALLLRAFFVHVLAWWVLIGKPPLDIPRFFSDPDNTPHPAPPSPQPSPNPHALPAPDSPVATNPNPWTWLIQQAIVHPDDHFPKCQRALYHYAQLYGARPKGYWSGTELEGVEEMDGSLFVRAAGLTQKRVGRPFEKVPKLQIYWDRKSYIPGAPHDSY